MYSWPLRKILKSAKLKSQYICPRAAGKGRSVFKQRLERFCPSTKPSEESTETAGRDKEI